MPEAVWFRRWTALSALALLCVTFRLWLPQTLFPRVPFVAAAIGWPDGVDLLAIGAMFGGLLLTFTPQRQGFGWFVFVGACVLAVLADQHRLQPWAYQFAILAVVFVTASGARSLQLARWLAIGILLHSAHSKLDYAFLHETGRPFVDQLAGLVGLDTRWWSDGFRALAAADLPVGELVIAIGLLVPATRRSAAWAAVALHVVLLGLLGPWGLDHGWGVLLWNVFFIGQTLLLFTPWRAGGVSPLFVRESPEPVRHADPVHSVSDVSGRSNTNSGLTPPARRSALWLAEIAVGFALLAPCLEPFGMFDHWPAWSVYSARSERVTLFVSADVHDELPRSLVEHVDRPGPDGWCRVRLDRWSLAALGVPMYPQERFRLGVARAVVDGLPDDTPFRIVIDGVPNRWNGKRERTTLTTRRALVERSAGTLLNAVPKPSG